MWRGAEKAPCNKSTPTRLALVRPQLRCPSPSYTHRRRADASHTTAADPRDSPTCASAAMSTSGRATAHQNSAEYHSSGPVPERPPSEVGQNSGPCSGRAAATTWRMRHRLEATVRHPRQQHCARAAAVKLMPSMPRAETMRELLWRAREGAARERGRGASASARGGRREAAGAAMGTPHGGQRDLKDVILIGRRRESSLSPPREITQSL